MMEILVSTPGARHSALPTSVHDSTWSITFSVVCWRQGAGGSRKVTAALVVVVSIATMASAP